jgi:hypothetical protein
MRGVNGRSPHPRSAAPRRAAHGRIVGRTSVGLGIVAGLALSLDLNRLIVRWIEPAKCLVHGACNLARSHQGSGNAMRRISV